MPIAFSSGTLRDGTVNKNYRPKTSRKMTGQSHTYVETSSRETISPVSSAVPKPLESPPTKKNPLDPKRGILEVDEDPLSRQVTQQPENVGAHLKSSRLLDRHIPSSIQRDASEGQHYALRRTEYVNLAKAAGRTAILGSQSQKPTPASIKTLNCSEDGSLSRHGENEAEVTPANYRQPLQQRHPYQPTFFVNEGRFIPNSQEQTASEPKKTDFEKIKAALTPKRRFLENYQDDGALRRAEKQKLNALGREDALVMSTVDHPAVEVKSKGSERSRWNQIKDTAKQLSPKLSPRFAAKFSDPFAAMKHSHERKKAEKTEAASEVSKAHQDAAAWGQPRTSDREGYKAWLEREKYKSEMKSKISRPIDDGRVFMVDRFGPSTLENYIPSPARKFRERGQVAQHGVSKIGTFIDAGKFSKDGRGEIVRQKTRADNDLPQEELYGTRTNSTRRWQKPREAKLDHKCVGIEGDLATSERTDQQCFFCEKSESAQGGGVCRHFTVEWDTKYEAISTRGSHGMREGKFSNPFSPQISYRESPRSRKPKERSNRTCNAIFEPVSPFSDPGNPFEEAETEKSASNEKMCSSAVHGNDLQITDTTDKSHRQEESTMTQRFKAVEQDRRNTSFYRFYDDVLASSSADESPTRSSDATDVHETDPALDWDEN